MTDLIPDTKAAMKFLKQWAPDGPWVLTAISTDRKQVPTRSFDKGQEAAMEKWIKGFNGQLNIYFLVNSCVSLIDRKSKRENIKSMDWLHVDIDPRPREDMAEEKERALKRVREGHGGLPYPSVIIDSGNGIQAFWKLQDPVTINGDPDAYEDAKLYNRYIENTFDADDCHNVDRIMRLPGTINIPNDKKKKAGRVPQLASLVEFNDHIFPVDDFKKAPKADTTQGTGFDQDSRIAVQVGGNIQRLDTIDDLPEEVGLLCRVVIVQGHDPDNPDKWGSNSEAVWWVTNELIRAKCDDETIFSVLTDPGFAISEHVLKQPKPRDYTLRQIGRAKEGAIHPMLAKLNSEYAVVKNLGGKCKVVYEELEDFAEHKGKEGRAILNFMAFEDFKNAWMNKYVETDNGKGGTWKSPAGKWWLEHELRREYDKVIFDPEAPDRPNVLNRWRGFRVNPKSGGGHEDFLTHILDNLCGGNEEYYTYLVKWMARAVQHPADIGHVAVVLRGSQGSGKGFFSQTFGYLFGRHFLHITNSSHLVGNFNAHLEDCVLLFADEAFFAGDNKHASILKTIITENMNMVEYKGVNAEQRKSCIHLIMASNAEWVVPVALDDRRFFMLDVLDNHMQDSKYFAAINRQLEAGGYESLLQFLLEMDLTGFNPRDFPRTKAHDVQRNIGAPAWLQWWTNKLTNGAILPKDNEWKDFVPREELFDDFTSYMQRWHRFDRPPSQSQLVRHIGALTTGEHKGKVVRSRRQISRSVMDHTGFPTTRTFQADGFIIPKLDTCREHLKKLYGKIEEFDDTQIVMENIEEPPDPESII